MTPARRSAACLLVALAALAASPSVGADRAAADFFAQRGDKAIKERKWADAQVNYRKALEEEEVHLSARVGLGEAFFGAGDRGAAVEAWRRAVADADAMKPLPSGWTDAVGRAKKRLAEVDVAGAALAQIVDKYVADLVGLAERWTAKDREVAARALRDAVRLRPAHPKAAAMFARIGSPPAEWTPLFDGRSMNGWDADEHWKVVDGEMIADITTGTYIIAHKRTLKGDFDVRVEAKVLERREGIAAFVIGAAVRFNMTGTMLGLANDELNLREQDGPEKAAQQNVFSAKVAELPNPFDPLEWTTYEMQFRGNQVHVLVNGHELTIRPRAKGREEGEIAFIVQAIRVAVRKVDVMQR